MGNRTSAGPKLVIILSDGIRGHENQSEGVAWWLGELCGAAVQRFRIPRLEGSRRFWWYKIRAIFLKKNSRNVSNKWLARVTGGKDFHSEIESFIRSKNVETRDVLFLSAGSSAAPWCLALSRVLGAKCCTIMTPSVLGTGPFDFAVVPKHDYPKPAPNVFVTLGTPNMIRPDLLEAESARLAEKYPPQRKVHWAVLLGGDDANYRMGPEWVNHEIPKIFAEAQKADADVFITTSRRTSPEAETTIIDLSGNHENVRALTLASKEPWNPVPGMLGLCERVYCTEDSVSMISEAFTAGCEVDILRVERRRNIRVLLQEATRRLVSRGLISHNTLWGVPRFDTMIDSFERVNEKNFNETRRAAMWVIEEWSA